MKKLFLLFTVFLFTAGRAQQVEPFIDSLEVAVAEEEMLYKEDTLSYVFYTLPSEVEYIPGEDNPQIIKERLAGLQKIIALEYNDRIHAFINYFTVRDREYTKMVARRRNLYFPIFEKYLAKYKLPDELKYLSIIESGLNPKAISRARAVGLWQFMSPTGRHYGLHIDWYIDERMDPEKSTDAACRYLRDLYGIFNDWELALAAYNTGPGNVKKAIRRSGYKKSFWQIYPFLPRETRSYVPQYVAILYTINYLAEHNFLDDERELTLPSDTLLVNKFFHFETFSNLTGVCLEDLQKINPSVLRNAVPDKPKPYPVLIPQFAKAIVEKDRLAILDSASKIGKKELDILARYSEGSTYGRDKIVYRVRSGDVLGSIAMRFHVRVSDIKQWNNLSSNTIRVGQHLNIWTKTPAEPAVAIAKQPVPIIKMDVPDSKKYVVQEGDTLWDISRKFEGLSIEKLKSMNNLTTNKIQPGQTLIIAL